jgi:hypothetical protein
MNSAHLLVAPPNGQDARSDLQKEVWEKSHLRIQKILPGFLEDFVAQSEQAVPASVVPSTGGAEKQEEAAGIVEEKSNKSEATVESKD